MPPRIAHLARLALPLFVAVAAAPGRTQDPGPDRPRAFVDGSGPGWRSLTLADFVATNGGADTWSERDGVIRTTGRPIGAARSHEPLVNFELVFEWRHLEHGGNSGLFVWCPESAFTDLEPGELPRSGIEVQILDLGYEENWRRDKGARSDWFTSHGDVFPVGASTMRPFRPQARYREGSDEWSVGAPDGRRSFPAERRTRPHGQWNHYYVRAINGELRLWVDGEEVNGGAQCAPAQGFLALEAEGAPVEFRHLRLRELP